LENLKGRHHLKDLGVDGRLILVWIFREIGWEGVNWIHLSQNWGLWHVLVNMVMDL
jgi:hypothetical protein